MRLLEGECVDVEAIQGYYPPILQFDVRLKNDAGNYWYFFGYGGLLHIKKDKTTINIGKLDFTSKKFDLPPKEERSISPTIELDYKKLDFIEELRKGDLHLLLRIDLLGVILRPKGEEFEMLSEGMSRGLETINVWVSSPNYPDIVVPQSRWMNILERLDYGKFRLVELTIPTFPSGVLEDAIKSFEKAKAKFNDGDYVKVLVHCQDVMDKIGKATKPFKTELEEHLGETKFKRVNKLKEVLETFLGLRHEVALEKEPIIRRDAELALQVTLSILNYFANRLSELKKK